MLADDWVQLWLYIINEANICIHLTRGVPVALSLTNCLNLRDSNTSKPKRPENAFSICSFLPAGKWSHKATILLLSQFYALMSIGRICYADLNPHYARLCTQFIAKLQKFEKRSHFNLVNKLYELAKYEFSGLLHRQNTSLKHRINFLFHLLIG